MIKKSILSLVVICSIILNLFYIPVYAVESQVFDMSKRTTECTLIGNQMFYTDESLTCGAIGSFYQDEFMNISWFVRKDGKSYVYETIIQKDDLSPFQNPDGSYNLLDLVLLADSPNFNRNLVDCYSIQSEHSCQPANLMLGNTAQKNAVRSRLGEYENLSTYSGREIRTNYVHSPAVLAVFETRSVNIHEMLDFQTFNAGFSILSTAATLAGLWLVPLTAVQNFILAVTGITTGFLATLLTVEKYSASIDYYRTGGYKTYGESLYNLCSNINEEYNRSYIALVAPSELGDSSDYVSVTRIVDGPNESYLNSATTYSEDHILNRAYQAYLSHG